MGGLVILNMDYIVNEKQGKIIMKEDKDSKVFGKKIEDYFETAKRYLLADPKGLLQLLQTYKKENINPKYISKL